MRLGVTMATSDKLNTDPPTGDSRGTIRGETLLAERHFRDTYFICLTIVLFPDSPAPERQTEKEKKPISVRQDYTKLFICTRPLLVLHAERDNRLTDRQGTKTDGERERQVHRDIRAKGQRDKETERVRETERRKGMTGRVSDRVRQKNGQRKGGERRFPQHHFDRHTVEDKTHHMLQKQCTHKCVCVCVYT